MILEGILTTTDASGGAHITPLGPRVVEPERTLLLRPFQGSTTLENLRRTGQAVFHVVDDVVLLAQAAIHAPLDPPPRLERAAKVDGWVLVDACRWYELQVETIDDSQERVDITARVQAIGRGRDYFGLNRAKHAVLEAAILATRVHFLPAETVRAELDRWRPLVEKTGGPAEHAAWRLLEEYTAKSYRS